ncbi:putative non-specific serine/threonine protein kinase [Helianthus debilis subsp. tardiflorus]
MPSCFFCSSFFLSFLLFNKYENVVIHLFSSTKAKFNQINLKISTHFFDLFTGHPWVQVDGVAPDKPFDSAVLSRIKQFSAMNKLKKMAPRVIAESLFEEEIAWLKLMFQMINADNSGQITFEELKAGLKRVDANLKESEIYDLMQEPAPRPALNPRQRPRPNPSPRGGGLGVFPQPKPHTPWPNSGTIDYGEFVAATLHLNNIEKVDHLFGAFSYFDKDGSGHINAHELQQACDEFGINAPLEELIQDVDQDNASISTLIISFCYDLPCIS